MIKLLNLFLTFSLLLVFNFAFSQSQAPFESEVSVTYANYLGKTPPIRDLVPVPKMDPEKRKLVKKNKKAPSNFAGRGKYVSTNPDALPQGPDKLWQKGFNKSANDIFIEPSVNIQGITSGTSPNDPSGDIGADSYLQAVNATNLAVFDKEGNQIGNNFSANTIWSQVGFQSAGDPIILYDQEANRWIITEFPFGNQLLVAISDDSDPMGSYTAYNFGTPNFPDYPKYGVWSNAYTVTTNEQGPGVSPCYFINRESMLNGDANVPIIRITIPGENGGPGFQVDTPVDWTGLTPPPDGMAPLVVSMIDDAWGAGLQDQIDIYSFNLDWDNPNNSGFELESVPVSPFDSNPCSVTGPGFACIPQMNGSGLDGLPETIMNQPHYRNFGSYEVLLMCYVTDVTGGDNLSGIRWVELRRTAGSDWEVYQEGTYAPDDGLDRFMPSICMDGNGNIGLGYSTSSENSFADVRFTGRRASDPLGEMTVLEYIAVEGNGAINSDGRFGDYAHMSVDPANDRTFWFTTEYAGGNVRTRIVAFELSRDTTDIGPLTLLTPQDSDALTDAETVTMEVKNFGLDTPSVFQVGYVFENGTPVVENVNFTLLPDSIYTHTFTPTVDMNEVGPYNFRLFTSLPFDNAPLNDTLRAVVSKLPQYDVGVANIVGLPIFSCDESLAITYDVVNFGTLPLTDAIITVDLNGMTETINWTGSLEMGESETQSITLNNFMDGTNQLNISATSPNGNTDQNLNNDAAIASFDALLNASVVTLNLNTDEYPEETTWEIEDSDGNVIALGGPYEGQTEVLIPIELCLDPEECYSITMSDSYGDGICCGFGLGNYEIVDAEGLPLVTSDGDFGDQETLQFCATFECMMTADIDVSPESGADLADGTIVITPQNGIMPFNYSIDGGETFQSSNIFDGLSGGTYQIIVTGEEECFFEDTVVLPSCGLMVSVVANDDTDAPGNAGSIVINATGGQFPVEYSIDGGNTTQTFGGFNGLAQGVYNVWVKDGNDCIFEMEVVLDEVVSSEEIIYGQTIEVLPNPTTGLFRINATGVEQASSLLKFYVFNAAGQRIQKSSLAKYNDAFTGEVSLVKYPDGVYFIQFDNPTINRLVRVVKQE